MNNPRSNDEQTRARRALPYFVEFVKFSTAFAAIVAIALFTLHVATAAVNQ